MVDVNLKGYKVTKLEFVNNHDNGTKIQFSNKISYNVKYMQNNMCQGQLDVELFDKEQPDKFGVKLIIDGFFDFNPEIKKETVHVLTFKEIYPVAKSIVASVSVNAGVPPIFLPPFDIGAQPIYKFDKNI